MNIEYCTLDRQHKWVIDLIMSELNENEGLFAHFLDTEPFSGSLVIMNFGTILPEFLEHICFKHGLIYSNNPPRRGGLI